MDPVIGKIISLLFLIFWATSAFHKIQNVRAFEQAIRAYEITPDFMSFGLALTLICAEVLIAVLWVFDPKVAGCLTLLLLSVYTFAMGFNLLRGHKDHDCGCAWGLNTSENSEQKIGRVAIVRNLAIMLLASAIFLPQSSRVLAGMDWINICLETGFILIMVHTIQIVLFNHQKFKEAGYV